MKISTDPTRAIQVLHVTDTHLAVGAPAEVPPKSLADASALLNGRTTDESLDVLLDQVPGHDVDLVLHTGDLLESPGAEDYHRALARMERLGHPLLVTAGNHDDPDLLGGVLTARGLPQRCVDAGNWRIIVLNSIGPDHGGHLGDTELSALYEYATEWDGPVLVGLHHPPLSTCSHIDCALDDAGAFFDTLRHARNVAAVASGHLHAASEAERSGVRYLLGPATCLQLEHKHPLPDHNKSSTKGGVRRIQLLPDGQVQSTLHWA